MKKLISSANQQKYGPEKFKPELYKIFDDVKYLRLGINIRLVEQNTEIKYNPEDKDINLAFNSERDCIKNNDVLTLVNGIEQKEITEMFFVQIDGPERTIIFSCWENKNEQYAKTPRRPKVF